MPTRKQSKLQGVIAALFMARLKAARAVDGGITDRGETDELLRDAMAACDRARAALVAEYEAEKNRKQQ